MSHFDAYGRIAQKEIDPIFQNGRYPAQRDAQNNIPPDVERKLKINSSDNLLDVGCGMGLNLIPLSNKVKSCTGCDHPDVIARLKKAEPNLKAQLIGADFLMHDFKGQYSKILIYSVLPALPNKDVMFAFIDKAIQLLSPDGILLFGDLANTDKKKRFVESRRGQEFQKEWLKKASTQDQTDGFAEFEKESECVAINDTVMMEVLMHVRKTGRNAYVCAQPENLPFGNTREDIVVYGPEYKSK
jgi:2-polyprenyl-3-methyl-5-hydroxy-6-metoxy-1,4-benzoquinol methylase